MRQFKVILKFLRRFIISFCELFLLPLYYLLALVPKDKNLWVFSSWYGQKYSDNSRMLFEYINKNNHEIKAIWIFKNRNILEKLKEKNYCGYYAWSVKGVWSLLRARRIFTTTGCEFSLFFCKGAEYYALWHGMPLKKILNDDTHFGGKAANSVVRRKVALILRRLFRWHSFLEQKNLYTITNSDFFTQFLITAFGIPREKILQVGSPRCDALFFYDKEPLLESIRREFREVKIILYMPTFRTSAWTGEVFDPFRKEFGFEFAEFLNVLEQHNYVFIYKAHFSDLQFMKLKQCENYPRFITITEEAYDELYNFIGQIDILVTDYSSIYFDFIATYKPVVLLPFDYDFYIKYARKHYFSYEEVKGIKALNWKEFYDILANMSYYQIDPETVHKFAEYVEDGHCCKKLLDAIHI